MSLSHIDALSPDELLSLVGLHDPVPIKVAAKLTGISQDLIRQWKKRGRLDAAGHNLSGRPLYRPIDVLRAEARASRTGCNTPRQPVLLTQRHVAVTVPAVPHVSLPCGHQPEQP